MTDFILGVFEITIGMSLFIALLLLGLKLFGGKFTAKCRYIIWALVMIRLAIPFSFGLLPTLIEIPIDTELVQSQDLSSVLSENTDSVTSVQPSDPGDVVVTPTTPVFPNVDTANPGSKPILPVTPTVPGDQAESVIPSDPVIETPTEQPVSLRQILDIAGIVYLTGAAIFLVWSLVSYFIYTRKILHSAKAADDRTQKIFSAICKKYGMNKLPTLLVASGIHSPAAFGIFRRKIVLPDIAFTENGLVGTLAHEVTHCKRGDLYMKLVELIACSLNWFNPLVHIAAFQCEMEMELSCDEKVLSGSSDAARAAYANVMLDIIRRCRRNRGALTTHFNPKKSAVTARFKNILYGSGKRRGRILIGVCLVLCVLAGAFVACQIGDDLPEDHWYAEGYYLKCDNGSDVIVMDADGANPASPCQMTPADDSVSFEGLTDGDRIKVEISMIMTTYPGQTEVYSIEKLSDGERDDIDSAILDNLHELGWIDDTTNQKELPKYLEIPAITLTQIETLPYSEETAVFTASPVGRTPTIFFFDNSLTFYFRNYLSTNMDAEFFTGTLTLPDGFTDAKLLHVTRGAGSGEIFVSIEAIYDGKKEYLTYGFFGTEAPSGVDVLDEVRVQRLMEAMEQMPAMFSITRPSDYTESDVIDVCSDEYGEVIAVTSNVDLSGIEIVEIVRENDFEIAELITLHTVDLVAGEPLLLKVSFPGVTGNRGLIYRDTDGMKKCCEITKSGEDGKILLISSESMAEKVDDTPKHSYTSDIDNFIPPEADSLPKITVLTTGKVLLTYETEEKLPLVYFGQGVDAETMQVTKTEFEAPDFSYTDFEVIDYLYESGYNVYATVRFTQTDGTQTDVYYYGYMGEYTFKEDYEYEYKWRSIRTEPANEINLARGQYDPAQQAALIPNQNAQVLFWLRTQSRCYYFCSIRTLNSAANAYTDDPPKDFVIYYQQYDQNTFSVIDEPIPEEYPYDSIVPVLAITGEECISMRCILQLTDGDRTYYISYQAYEGIDQVYHPISDDEAKMLAKLYPGKFEVDDISADINEAPLQSYYQMWYDKKLTTEELLNKNEVREDIAKKVKNAVGVDLHTVSFTWEYRAEEDRYPLRFFVTDDAGEKMIEANIIRYKDETDGIEKFAVEVNPVLSRGTVNTEAIFTSILENKQSFYDGSSKESMLLSEYKAKTDYSVKKYTILDLNDDRDPEMVLWLGYGTNDYVGFLVLHRYGNAVYSHEFPYRGFNGLNADGIYTSSSSAFNMSICKLSFDGDTCRATVLARREGDGSLESIKYYIADREVKKDEFESYYKRYDSRSIPDWYSYDIETITNIDDWHMLLWSEYPSEDDRKPSQNVYNFIYNLVSGESDIPELNGLGIKDYSIALLKDSAYDSLFRFTFTVTGNSLPQTLLPGTYTWMLLDGMELSIYTEGIPATQEEAEAYWKRMRGLDRFEGNSAVEAVNTYLSWMPYIYEVSPYGKWDPANYHLPYNYICAYYGQNLEISFSELQTLMTEKFGIEVERPEKSGLLSRCEYDKERDTVRYADTRGYEAVHRFLDVREEDGITYVSVMLFADKHYLIPSHTIQYKIGEGDVFLGCEIIREGNYEPRELS